MNKHKQVRKQLNSFEIFINFQRILKIIFHILHNCSSLREVVFLFYPHIPEVSENKQGANDTH